MAEEKRKKDPMTCQDGRGMCGYGYCGNYYGLRIVRAIFLVIMMAIVFMLGVKIGELRGMLAAYYGNRMMRPPYYYGQPYPITQGGPGMMIGTSSPSTATSSQ
jgi:hypothetical protein